ncbi:MAG TPA: hypothetical protein VFT55_11715 [Planctomycetota bacterium]|nr:hypothetical protein [Planctomycetota bacterium]
MALSHDIVLAADCDVAWPAECPGCGAAGPRNLLPVSGSRWSFASFLWPVLHLFSRRAKYEVPTCDACRGAELRSRWMRFLVFLAITIAAVAVASPWASEQTGNRFLRKLIVLGVVLAALAPLCVWQALAPPAIDITLGKKTVTFEFRREAYALAFVARNTRT